MSKGLIGFKQMEWTSRGPGLREKRYKKAGQTLRLVEFSSGFIEKEWCIKAHFGYVLDGSFSIDFDGKLVNYRKGEGIWIEEGLDNKHKAILKEGERVLLILFEGGF